MACKYTYNGKEYSKEELVAELGTGFLTGAGKTTGILKSVAARKKKKQSQVVSDTLKLLEQRYSDAKNMLQAIKNSNDPKEVKLKKTAVYKGIMERTLASKKELLQSDLDKQLDYILDQALVDAKLVEALYTSTSITFNELQFANEIVESWLNLNNALGITDLFKIEDEALRDKVKKILFEFSLLDQKARALSVELIKQSVKGGQLTEDQITKITDTTVATEYTRELTTTGIPIANKLSYIIKEVNLKINKEHNNNYSEIDEKYNLIKNHPLIKGKGFDLFLKETTRKDGTKTLGMVTRYTSTFWKALGSNSRQLKKELNIAGTDKTKSGAAWKRFHLWNETNTIGFNALLFMDMAKYPDSMRDIEINRMKQLGFNTQEINDIIMQSQKRYEKFEEAKEEYEAVVEQNAVANPAIIPQGMTLDAYIKKEVEEFDDLNSPLKYMDQKFFGAQKITAYGGAKYAYLIPAKSIKGVPTDYYDANFSKIAADKNLFEFYNWFTGMMTQSLSWFPQEEIEDLQSNFFPVIAERMIKEYSLTDLKESVAGLGEWFMKSLTNVDYQKRVETNPFSKKERRGFDAKFINEDVAIEERSKDLVMVAKMFSDMALIYKHKNTVRAEVDTINDVITATKGSYKLNKKLGIVEFQQKDATHLKSLVDFTVKKGFYGIPSEDALFESDQLFYDAKELLTVGFWQSAKAKKAQEISLEIKRLTEALKDPKITEEQADILEESIETKKREFYDLGGRKFSFTKTIDTAISGTRLTALGLAPLSAARNLVVGKINNRLHAKGGRDFTTKEQNWANRLLLESAANYWSGGKIQTDNTRKIFGVMSDSGLTDGIDGVFLQKIVDKKSTLDTIRELMPKAYTWLSSGDYHFKAEMMLSAMKFKKVKVADGTEVSFWDTMDADRTYNESKYGAWDPAANNNMNYEDFYNDQMLKYKQLASKLHGAAGRDSYVKGKDTAIGRLLFLFKSWLPETVGIRFDPKHQDGILNRDEEGYYRTLFNILAEKKSGALKMIMQAVFNKEITGIDDEMTLANFKKAVYEMKVIAGLMITYTTLKAMAPEDDKDKKLYNIFVLRQLHDLNRDLTYYISLNSIADLQTNIFPIITTALNWGSAVKAVAYYSFGVEDEDGELLYDAERTALKVTKVLPVLNNINRFVYYQKAID